MFAKFPKLPKPDGMIRAFWGKIALKGNHHLLNLFLANICYLEDGLDRPWIRGDRIHPLKKKNMNIGHVRKGNNTTRFLGDKTDHHGWEDPPSNWYTSIADRI